MDFNSSYWNLQQKQHDFRCLMRGCICLELPYDPLLLLFSVLASKIFQCYFFLLMRDNFRRTQLTNIAQLPLYLCFLWHIHQANRQLALQLDFLLLFLVLYWTMWTTVFRNIRNCLPSMPQETWWYLNGKMQIRSLWFPQGSRDIICSVIAKLKWFFLEIWKAFERVTGF